MLTFLLRRKGIHDNHKRIERIYQEEGLQVRKRRRRRYRFSSPRVIRPVLLPDERWSADFVHDSILDGRPFRCLAVIDHVTREALSLEVGRTIGGERVVAALETLKIGGRAPRDLQLDNGPEFRSFALNQRCHENVREPPASVPSAPAGRPRYASTVLAEPRRSPERVTYEIASNPSNTIGNHDFPSAAR